MAVKMDWRMRAQQYGPDSRVLRIGRITVGSVTWLGTREKGDPRIWGVFCKLPGLKSEPGAYETEVEAKARLEEIVTAWLAAAGLEEA